MEFLIVGLVLVSAAALSAALGIVIYRQKMLRELKGKTAYNALEKIKGLLLFARGGVFRLNRVFASAKRYDAVFFNLRKINGEAMFTRESFVFAEQAAFAAVFMISFLLFESAAASAALAVAGFFIPSFIAGAKAREKEEKILREMPDALDIIAAGIEGGLSLSASLTRYASGNKNDFAAELLLTVKKAQLGTAPSEAMREMDEKLGIKEVTRFAAAYSQAVKSGGSVKQIIKGQAEEARKQRFMRLKKLAHEAPVKMLIPLMLFIFPVVFIVLFGPIVIKLMEGF